MTLIGHEARTKTELLLSQALKEGFLDLEEYQERYDATIKAKTSDQLILATIDLPVNLRWLPNSNEAFQKRSEADYQRSRVKKWRAWSTIFGTGLFMATVCMIIVSPLLAMGVLVLTGVLGGMIAIAQTNLD